MVSSRPLVVVLPEWLFYPVQYMPLDAGAGASGGMGGGRRGGGGASGAHNFAAAGGGGDDMDDAPLMRPPGYGHVAAASTPAAMGNGSFGAPRAAAPLANASASQPSTRYQPPVTSSALTEDDLMSGGEGLQAAGRPKVDAPPLLGDGPL
jgi:hypothetical protein